MDFWTLCPKVGCVIGIMMDKVVQKLMEKKRYISEEEQKKCRRVADAFAELEEADIVVLDAGRYGFVKLQYYTPSIGFENDVTFVESREMFEDLWNEWMHFQLFMLAEENSIGDVDYDEIFQCLPEEKQKELLDRKETFAKKAGIVL